jgi:hypothetical protein
VPKPLKTIIWGDCSPIFILGDSIRILGLLLLCKKILLKRIMGYMGANNFSLHYFPLGNSKTPGEMGFAIQNQILFFRM